MSAVQGGEKLMSKSPTKSGLPFADTPIAQYLTKQIEVQQSLGKNQREIADEIGYDKANMISMFKTGAAKVPLDKVPALARALKVDPAFLFRLAIQQYWADEGAAIAEIFGTVLTKNETKMIEIIRKASGESDPPVTGDLERKLRALFK